MSFCNRRAAQKNPLNTEDDAIVSWCILSEQCIVFVMYEIKKKKRIPIIYVAGHLYTTKKSGHSNSK